MGQKFSSAFDLAQLSTPSGNPAASRALLYFKSDGFLYTKSSAGVEKAVGEGMFSYTSHIHTPGAWQTMTPLTSPWVNGSTSPRYRLENDGYICRLAGTVSRPSGTNQPIFTLPVGYRPDRANAFSVNATSAYGRVAVTTGGVINFTTGTGTGDVSLDGITIVIV